MVLSGGRPSINTFQRSEPEPFSREGGERSHVKITGLFKAVQADQRVMKADVSDPGVWKGPRGHMAFSLSSQSLSIVCPVSLRLNQNF